MGAHSGVTMEFIMPDEYELRGKAYVDEKGRKHGYVPGVDWFTNLDHVGRHEPLMLDTMAGNLRYNRKLRKTLIDKYGQTPDTLHYPKYDNYDAIEVPYVECIPGDYTGVIGVPISFLDKYNPDQFELLGMCENKDLYGMKTRVYTSDECRRRYRELFGKPGVYDLNAAGVVNGVKVYQRILIRRIARP